MTFPPSRASADQVEGVALLEEKNMSDANSISSSSSSATAVSLTFAAPSQPPWLQRVPSIPKPSRPLHFLRRTAYFLVPSPFTSRLSCPSRVASSNGRLAPTAYLDGMRGMAAFFVFMCHYLYTSFVITEGYGVVNPENNKTQTSLLTLPFIRLIYSGPPMVCIFFVVSGYALSLKALRLMRTPGKRGEVGGVVGSMVFRRVLRLYLPTAISTFMVVILLRMGAYEVNRGFAGDKKFIRNVVEHHPVRMSTTGAQIKDWLHSMFNFLHVWSWKRFAGSTLYDVHLWTIPVEFRASMTIFVILVGTSHLSNLARMTAVLVATLFSYLWDKWEMVLFLAGLILAELDLIRASAKSTTEHETPTLPYFSKPSKTVEGRVHRLAWLVLSIPALYLMGQPDQFFHITPGWVWLSSLIPEWFGDKYRFWQCIGSILFVACVSRVPGWRRAFEHPIPQYMGKISYAIYLVHGPVIHTIGYTAERWAWGITGTGGYSFELGFGIASFVTVPAMLWAADVFARGVDQPCVKFARWVENVCRAKD
ncbi:putative hard surface induced protein 3-like protein [Zalerion maritima]|uniref:Hard surface induced protein 3-like protein n=1 Tax=Zalerion maritima TaxID=339359 RepID=A0AAD5RSI6_9PEZI|nr:putative hard surface induced protein 3-like protein [Zalerion maritima]